jgi:CRISPR-associated exonuclease Cas4
LAKTKYQKPPDAANTQSRAQFASEQTEVQRAFAPLRWIRPSDGGPDVVSFEASSVAAWEHPAERVLVRGGAMRGMILHKIMEEFVTGELKAEADAVRERSQRLLQELSARRRRPILILRSLPRRR